MTVRSGQIITVTFTQRNFSTGIRSNADSLPVASLARNGADTVQAVTVAQYNQTGRYTASVTLPTLAIADIVEIFVTGIVAGTTDGEVIWRDAADIQVDPLGDVTCNNVSGVTLLSSIDANGNIVLRQGADYLNVDGQALTFAWVGPDLTAALSVLFNLWLPSSVPSGPVAVYSFPGTVVNSQEVMIQMSRAQTATISLGTYNAEVFVQLADGDKLQLYRGQCLVRLP